MTLDATPKGASANSYITRADADAYFTNRLDVSEWDSASSANKDKALITATSRLEQESYVGSPTDTATPQRLKWPRWGVTDDDDELYDEDLIPRPVEEATCELALALLKGDVALKETGLEKFEQVGVGPVSVTPRHARKGGALPQQVVRLLRGVRLGSGITLNVVRS